MTEAAISPVKFNATTEPWTVEDLERLPEGQRYEIIDGSLIVSPRPAVGHQRIAARLVAALNHSMQLDHEAIEAVDVILRTKPSARVLQPDVLVVSSATASAEGTSLKPADVTLAAEVVSPSPTTMDRITKPTLLADAGVPAYWRVEQTDKGVEVALYRLVGSVYKEDDVVRAGEVRELEWPVTCRLAPAELTGQRRR